jgi:hypothetical protein
MAVCTCSYSPRFQITAGMSARRPGQGLSPAG